MVDVLGICPWTTRQRRSEHDSASVTGNVLSREGRQDACAPRLHLAGSLNFDGSTLALTLISEKLLT